MGQARQSQPSGGEMSKTRISSTQRKTKRSPEQLAVKEVVRFLGLSLSGGKADKACLAVLEYYPKHGKVFLTKIFEKVKNDEVISADLKIHEFVEQYKGNVESLAIDVPAQTPQCMRCELKCPGFENCSEPHIQWMWDYFKRRNKKKKPRKIFTPYTQRCIEMYLADELEEPFIVGHAMGANTAPLLARAHFLLRRLNKVSVVEVNPQVSLWRIGQSLKVMKSHLRFHRHSVSGAASRKAILEALNENSLAFLYQADMKLMIENNHAFESFICAYTAFLKYKNVTEKRPKNFPKSEDWIEIPEQNIQWKDL